MEFRRARLDEQPNEGLIARFEREIVPLLHDRGPVRRRGRLPALRRHGRRRRRPRRRLRLLERARPRPVARRLPQPVRVGRGLDPRRRCRSPARPRDGSKSLGPRDARRGARGPGRRRRVRRVPGGPVRPRVPAARPASCVERGLFVELDAYRCLVFGSFRELRDAAGGAWAELAAELGGRRRAVARRCAGRPAAGARSTTRVAALLVAGDLDPPSVATSGRRCSSGRTCRPRCRAFDAAPRLPRTPTAWPSGAALRPIDRARSTAATREALGDRARLGRRPSPIALGWPASHPRPGLARRAGSTTEVRAFLGVHDVGRREWFSTATASRRSSTWRPRSIGTDDVADLTRDRPNASRRAAEAAGYRRRSVPRRARASRSRPKPPGRRLAREARRSGLARRS